MIKLINISKAYGEKKILDNFSYEFPKSGFVAIVGPSGQGKTTLANIILGLKKPNTGTVEVNGTISAVFQENCLIPQKNVLFNTLLAAKDSKNKLAACKSYSDDNVSLENKATLILEELGLGNDLSTPIDDLSGGMARRVAIARSLCFDADIYIMDEPLSGLDEATRNQVLKVIQKYTTKNNKLLIMITHDKDIATLATQIIEL